MRLCLAIAIALAACGGSSKPAAKDPIEEHPEEIEPQEEDAFMVRDDEPEVPLETEEPAAYPPPATGNRDCDEYFTRMRCMNDHDPDVSAETREGLESQLGAYRDAVRDGNQLVVDTCRMVLDADADRLAASGC